MISGGYFSLLLVVFWKNKINKNLCGRQCMLERGDNVLSLEPIDGSLQILYIMCKI